VFEYLASIIIMCILFFKVMFSCLFKIIIVHSSHHWNYLEFGVFFKMTSVLIYPWMCFHIRPKLHWASMPSPLNIKGTIFSLNKLLLSFFCLCFYLRYFVPPCIWMVMEVSIACGYCTSRLKAMHIFNWLSPRG
jgi:hypothetical protein